ncbi:hypothetical protein NMU03_07555 [Allocoprobacillus halotolerans]|uniref:Uncharacterized protein n=1 Tax=Allocoprobacillus halotolerans TaxID=2944914 RepID=A0ABY5I5I2_9FIRM|nr:hypothetical protein [Allocoprobacillus halotolerans]UTY40616.1 hypothetical protein NMU03_07555 [Allocoprobacillus halotolerans]
MKEIILGSTGIQVVQNAFGALPVQRVSKEEGVKILRKAYDGGMRFLILLELIVTVRKKWVKLCIFIQERAIILQPKQWQQHQKNFGNNWINH